MVKNRCLKQMESLYHRKGDSFKLFIPLWLPILPFHRKLISITDPAFNQLELALNKNRFYQAKLNEWVYQIVKCMYFPWPFTFSFSSNHITFPFLFSFLFALLFPFSFPYSISFPLLFFPFPPRSPFLRHIYHKLTLCHVQ